MPDRKPSSQPFSQPWTIDERAECFIVSDTRGNSLAHVYFEDEPTRRDLTKRLSKYDARRDGAADLASIGTGRARAPASQPAMTWSRRFDEPIVLPDGGRLATLRQAGDYISALPAATQNPNGIAGRDRGADPGRRARRRHAAAPHCHDARPQRRQAAAHDRADEAHQKTYRIIRLSWRRARARHRAAPAGPRCALPAQHPCGAAASRQSGN